MRDMPEQFSDVATSSYKLASPAASLRVFKLVTLLMFLCNYKIKSEPISQPEPLQTTTCSSLNASNQVEVNIKLEDNKQNPASTKALCQTTFEQPKVYVNNDSTVQSASILEPVYFGTYPTPPNSNNHNLPPVKRFRQHPSQSATNNFFATQTGSSSSLPTIDSSFYQPKESSDLEDASYDPIAKPVFEQDLTDDQDDKAGQIVTLQAFGSEGGDSHLTRATGGGLIRIPSASKDATSRSRYHGDLLAILRKLPPSKQVQLINSFGSASSVPLERPSLNLVSGSMRVAAPVSSHLIPIGVPKITNPDSHEELLELLSRIKSANSSPASNSDENSISETDNLKVTDDSDSVDATRQPIKQTVIKDEDKEFLKSLVHGLNLARKEGDTIPQTNHDGAQDDEKVTEQQAIPIARLVDHLMENSRLSTFGVQHEDGLPELPEEEEEVGEVNPSEEEEEEEEEDEEEPDNENEPNEEAQESGLVVHKHLSPMMQGFSSILNQSSSWIPMDSLNGLKHSLGAVKKKDDKKKDDTDDDKLKKSKKGGKRRKRKRKRKKKKKRVFSLIVGDKVFSNADLVRLIEILNKLASKGKTKAERESSKKLLRYLVKLMLDEYRRNSTGAGVKNGDSGEIISGQKENNKGVKLERDSVGSIRDLLRTHLQSPDSNKHEEPKKSDTASSTQVDQPKEQPPPERTEKESKKLEKLESKKEDKVTPGDKKEDESNKSDDEKKTTTKNNSSILLGLDKITEDLEHYFDTDFYEDMADDLRRNKTHISLASGAHLTRVPRHRRQPPRLIYTVPVPIYGQQLFEAADEDDTDFDAVTVPVPRRNRQIGSRRRSYIRRALAPSRRNRRHRKRPVLLEAEAVEATEPEEEEEEEREEEEEPEEAVEKELPAGEQPIAASDQTSSNELIEQKPEPEQAETPDLERIQEQPPEQFQEQPPERAVRKDNRGRRRRKRRRRKSIGLRGRIGQSPKTDIDYDSRYEIPAPLGAAAKSLPVFHNVSTTSSRALNKRLRQQTQLKKPGPGQKIVASSKKVSRRIKPKNPIKIPKPTTERHRRTQLHNAKKPIRLLRRRKPPGKQDPDEPATGEPGPGEADEDYYNDSSSYTKICDDNNKCEVKVQKSGPKKRYRKSEI